VVKLGSCDTLELVLQPMRGLFCSTFREARATHNWSGPSSVSQFFGLITMPLKRVRRHGTGRRALLRAPVSCGWLAALAALTSARLGSGCATFGKAKPAADSVADAQPGSDVGSLAVSMPADASEVRDDQAAAILMLSSADQIVFPYVYGYPIYPEGALRRGIAELRAQNRQGAERALIQNDSGVTLAREELPELGCRFDGYEDRSGFVPIALSCELPAPKALGGARRPVIGAVAAFAKPDQLLQDPEIKQLFFGAFHLTSDDFAGGSGTGYFNTTHGQLAFGFAHAKLVRFTYYFDPGVKAWQDPQLWVQP
jgi:hypothetical protein